MKEGGVWRGRWVGGIGRTVMEKLIPHVLIRLFPSLPCLSRDWGKAAE